MNLNALLKELKLSKDEFLFQFRSHPAYPSALAFSDTLNFLGVKNEAYELEKQYWHEIDRPFITVYDNRFSLVSKQGEKYKVISDKILTTDGAELSEKSSDLVMLFDKQPIIGKATAPKYLPFFLLAVVLFLVSVAVHGGAAAWAVGLLSMVGLYLSIEVIKERYGEPSAIVSGLCGGEQQAAEPACSGLVKSDKVNFFGLKMADLSLIYFALQSILVLFLPATAAMVKTVSLLTVPVILYSLYVQFFIEKTLCRVCMAIVAVLVTQLLAGRLLLGASFFTASAVLFTVLAGAVLVGLSLLINNLLTENSELTNANVSNIRFKRNYDLFRRELLEKERVVFTDNTSGFFFGKPGAPLHISLISSPYCGYCEGAHHILEELTRQYPDQISAQIRFNYAGSNDIEMENVMTVFKNNFVLHGPKATLMLIGKWYKNRDLVSVSTPELTKQVDLAAEAAIGRENRERGFNFTPVFLINGFQFPEMYEREDIFYFIEELIEDEDILY